MDSNAREKIRLYVAERLRLKDDSGELTDSGSLFVSGRLDSLDAIETIVFLESEFGVDFSKQGFDQSQLDTVNAIAALVGT
jgi:acyl carrier protein